MCPARNTPAHNSHQPGARPGYNKGMSAAAHILVVDDDEDILSLLTGFFRKHGHPITVATNGTDMFAGLEEGHP